MPDYVLSSLSFSYVGKKKEPITKVFENFRMEFDQGEKVFVYGPSGEGKTTLLKILAGLLDPEKGSLKYKGEEILDIKASSRDVAYLFQEPFLYPFMSVYSNFYIALNGYGLSRIEKDRMIKDIIKGHNIMPLLNYKPKQLSLGQKEIIALLRALIRKPSLLLADEPFSALDPVSKESLMKKMMALCGENNTTIVYVGHDINEARGFDTVYCLEEGSLTLVSKIKK